MKITEFEKGGVTQQQLDALESVLDKVFAKLGIDVEFTRHFLDRVNDERNIRPISIKELGMLFKKEFIKWGKPIAQMGPDAQAVMKDLETDINIPFVLQWNDRKGELELIAKTVMRKKNFKTSNKEFPVEAAYPAQQISRYNPDSETYRNGTGGGRIPNSKSVSKSDITVKRKKADFPDGATGDTTFDNFSKKELKQTALDVISELGKREQLILKARFGLEPFDKSYTIQQVASAMDLSPERIRQIEARALRLLKHPSRSRKLRSYMDENGLPPHLAKHFDKDQDEAFSNPFESREQQSIGSQINFPGMSKKTVKPTAIQQPKTLPRKPRNRFDKIVNWAKGLFDEDLNEDFGSIPPLTELIIMAVAAQTTVASLKAMFKVAIKTGKGLKSLRKLQKAALRGGEKAADFVLGEATREELLSQIRSRQEKEFYKAAIQALRHLVNTGGTKQSIGGYAFDIARAFNGVKAKELVDMYKAQYESIQEFEAKQSNPLIVLDIVSDRSDNKPFPVKFYDGNTINVKPKEAKRFMDKYYRMEPEQRDIVHKYIKTKKGFLQAIKNLNVTEGWSDKYKKSIDCNNPKGFSQKAHCDGRKKK